MGRVRFLLAIALLVGVLGFLLQNGTPRLSLWFLGIKTVALPLAVWIGLAIALGAGTLLMILGLLRLAYGRMSREPRRFEPEFESEFESEFKPGFERGFEQGFEPRASRSYRSPRWSESDRVNQTQPFPEEVVSDGGQEWEKDNGEDASDWFEEGDWDWEEEMTPPFSQNPRTSSGGQGGEPDSAERSIYEVRRSPMSSRTEGSVYAYRYREPSQSNPQQKRDGFRGRESMEEPVEESVEESVEKPLKEGDRPTSGSGVSDSGANRSSSVTNTDAVIDADYRLIRPPTQDPRQPLDPNPELEETDDENWDEGWDEQPGDRPW